MKSLLVLTCVLLATTLAACGGSSRSTPTHDTSATTPVADSGDAPGHRKKDRDNDEDNNDDDSYVISFGHVADPSEGRAVTALITSYFMAAASEDGAKACLMLTPFIAESVVEVDGRAGLLRGDSCRVVMSKLFRQHHLELTGKSAGLKVLRVGVEGDRSVAALEFSEIPVVRQIDLRRVNGKWTVLDLLDDLME